MKVPVSPCALLAALSLSFPASLALADIPAYTLVGSFPVPSGAWDIAPDGRLVQLRGTDLYRQDAVNAGTYTKIGSIPTGSVSSYGASFLRVSPSGSTIAIGDGNFNAGAGVALYTTASLTPIAPTAADRTITTPNYTGFFSDDNTLYVTGARSSDFNSLLNRVDLAPSTPVVSTLITSIGGASGGVTTLGTTLFTGTGYTGSGSPTGTIKSFSLGSLGGSPVAFSTGSPVTRLLSAARLDTDPAGNLLVGGGDVYGAVPDFGYGAVVDLSNPANVLKLSPAGTSLVYSIAFNDLSNELLVVGGGNAYRYAVPAPGAGACVSLGVLFASRRRRR